jgi:hypothetical protein
MSKFIHNVVYDVSFDYVITNANAMRICSSDVMTAGVGDYAKCTGAAALTGNITVSPGDLVKADHGFGRKLIMAAKSGITVTANGTSAHIVLLDTINSRVLSINETLSKELVTTEATDTTAFEVRLPQPV